MTEADGTSLTKLAQLPERLIIFDTAEVEICNYLATSANDTP